MRRLSLIRLGWLALLTPSALTLTLAPSHVKLYGAAGIAPSAAYAAGGNSGGHGNGGNGNSGGNSSSAGGGANSGSGNAGQGNSGKAKGNQGNHGTHVNAATGDTVEVDGDKITVIHRDGMQEEIENGRFKMQDALGRTIIERKATPEDVARLQAL
ncbi:hypothetical protein LJR234_003403 [Mesorhizobium amorphae]|uniref:hypothetical protein n=1 Tax=Mesorhizobium amorphae TaxID=71433 RepID=UPI003ECEC594